MGNRLLIEIKIGTQEKLNPQFAIMDGMLNQVIDETDPGWKGADVILGEQAGTAYGYIEVDRKYEALLKEYSQPINMADKFEDSGPNLRMRKGIFVLDDFKALISSDIVLNWRDKKVMPIIDGRSFEMDKLIKLSKDFDPSIKVIDINLVSTGSYTIGSGGQHYPNWASASGDDANLTGDLTFTQETAIANTAVGTFNVALGGYTYKLTSDTPHLGSPAGGHLTTQTGLGNGITASCTGTGTFEISELNILRAANTGNFARVNISMACPSATCNLYDIIANCTPGGTIKASAITLGAVTTGNADNIMAFDFDRDTGGYGIAVGDAAWKIENAYVMNNSGVGINCGSVACEVNNAYALDNGTDWTNTGSVVSAGDASSDATEPDGTNINLTTATEVISNSPASSDFAKPKTGGTIYNSGVTPDHTNDIAGDAWDTPPSIGVFQFPIVPSSGTIIPKLMTQYMRRRAA